MILSLSLVSFPFLILSFPVQLSSSHSHTTPPTPLLIQIHHDGLPPTPHNSPHDLLIRLIHLLMFGPSRNQSKIPRHQDLFFLTPFTHNRALTTECEDDGIFFSVMMDCGCRVWCCYHACCADVGRDVYEGVLARHALCLGAAAVGAEGGGGGYEDGVLGGHGFGIGLWELVGFWLVFCFGELLLLGNWLVFHQRGRLEIPWLRILFSTEVMVCGLKRVHLHLTLSLTDVTQASCPIYLMYLTGIGT